MPDLADLEYLRLQKARRDKNQAQGYQPVNQDGYSMNDDAVANANVFSSLPRIDAVASQQRQSFQQEQTQRHQKESDNWLSKAFGFVDEMAAQFGAGFVRAWEGLLDLGATALGALGDATGWYDSAPLTQWAQKDLGGQAANFVKTYLSPFNNVASIFNGNFGDPDYWKSGWDAFLDTVTLSGYSDSTHAEDIDKFYSFNDRLETPVGQFLGGAAQSVGFMVPSILMGNWAGAAGKAAGLTQKGAQTAAQAASLGQMGLAAAGKGSEEALNEGASAGQALGYGALSGAAEVGSELVVGKALGLVGLGTGKVLGRFGTGTAKNTAKVGSKLFLKQLGQTMFEEGMEEVSTAVLEPLFKSVYKGGLDVKGTYGNADWWFGNDGHFLESVAGQFASGAFVGGLSGGLNNATVMKKVGSDGYVALDAWRNLAEEDVKMGKEVVKNKIRYGTPEYEKANKARSEAASDFIDAMDKFLAHSTDSQKAEFARYITQDGALARDLQSERNADKGAPEIIDSYLKGIREDSASHERRTFRDVMNELQDRFGTDYSIVFDKSADYNGFVDDETKTIHFDEDALKGKGGAIIAHEYLQHAVGDSIKSVGIEKEMYERIVKETSKEWQAGVERRIEADMKVIDERAKAEGWDASKTEQAKRALIQDETVAYFLEDSIGESANNDIQLKTLRQIFKKEGILRRILNKLNKIDTFGVNRLAKEYVQVVSKYVMSMYEATDGNPVMTALAKYANGFRLTDSEERMRKNLANVFDAVKPDTEGGKELAKAFSRKAERGTKYHVGKNGIVVDNEGKRLTVSYPKENDRGGNDIVEIQDTVADKRTMEHGETYYVKGERVFFNDSDAFSPDMAYALFDNGYDVVVDEAGGDVFIADSTENLKGEWEIDEEGRDKAYSNPWDDLDDEGRERRQVRELSDDEFRVWAQSEKGFTRSYQQKLYASEIERRGLYEQPTISYDDAVTGEEIVIVSTDHVIPEKYYTRRMSALAKIAEKAGADFLFYSRTPMILEQSNAIGCYTIGVCHVDVSRANILSNREVVFADTVGRHEFGHFLLDPEAKHKLREGKAFKNFLKALDTLEYGAEIHKYLQDQFEDYKYRYSSYYFAFGQEADTKVKEEIFVQLVSESVLWPTKEGREFQNSLIKTFNEEAGIDEKEYNQVRYSRKTSAIVETSNMGDAVNMEKYLPKNGSNSAVVDGYMSSIVELSPNEYFDAVSQFQQGSDEDIKKFVAADDRKIQRLIEVLRSGKKLDMPYIKADTKDQEGRHRMYAIGEEYGWDTKVPVLRIDKLGSAKYSRKLEDRLTDAIFGDLLNDVLSESNNVERESLSDDKARFKEFKKAYHDDYEGLVKRLNDGMSEQAKEYFKDSVLRGNGKDVYTRGIYGVQKGLLVPFFHGTPSRSMYYFDENKMGTHGVQRGYGFYLTDNLYYAEDYADKTGKVILSFVNITNPMPDKEGVKIPKEEWIKFSKDLGIFSSEINKYLDDVFSDGDEIDIYKDYDLFNAIFRFQKNKKNEVSFGRFASEFKNRFGFDGYIAWNRTEGTVAVAFESNQIKDVANMSPTENPDIRYSRKKDKKAANLDLFAEGELVDDGIEIKAEKPKIKIPNEYVKAVAELNNDKVYAYSQVTNLFRSVSKDVFKALGYDAKRYRIEYNEQAAYEATKALFDTFNKKNVTANDIVEGLYDVFSDVRVVPKDGNAQPVALFGQDGNLFERSDVRQFVEDHLKEFLATGRDSVKTKVAKREAAFVELFKRTRATLLAYARDMRARIDATHTLRTTMNDMPEGFGREVNLNGSEAQNALTLRTQMSSVIAAPFLNIPYKRNGNFGTLLKTYQELGAELDKVLANYTEEAYDKMSEKPMFPFDQGIRDMIQEFRDSLNGLPAPKVRKDGVVLYPNLTTAQIKQATAILEAVGKLHKKTVNHYSETLAPQVKGARRQISEMGGKKFLRFLTLNPYVFNAASFYAVINARLGNSTFARNVTIGMELADGKRKAYMAETARAIEKKLKELGLEDEMAKMVTFNGVQVQVGHLIDLYCGLKSYDFDNFDKNGVTVKDSKGVVHKIVEAGQANEAFEKVRNALSENAKKYGDWLLSEQYNSRFLNDYVKFRTKRGYHYAKVSGNYYPQSADLSSKPTDVTQMVRAPKVFQNDKARVVHNNPFVLHDATRRVMQYANDLGTAMYVYPLYRENFYVLQQTWNDLGSNATDIKFREALRVTLGMWVGLDVNGNKSVKGPINFLMGNYTRTLLSMNFGTPFKQTISLLFSNLSLPYAIKGVAKRLFGSQEFKDEFHALAKRFTQMALRSIGSENVKLDLSTGAGKVVHYLRRLSDIGMKPIEWFDNATIQAGLASSMSVAKDMGYKMGTDEYRSAVEELFSNFVETQIGSNPSNLNRLSRGDSPLKDVGRFVSFMQGPMRAALAAFVDKITTWSVARGWTKAGIDSEIARTTDAMNAAQEAYDKAVEAQKELEQKLRDVRSDFEMEADEKADRIKELSERIEKAEKATEQAMDELAEATSEKEQAEQNKKTFIKYQAQGGKAWMVSTLSAMAVGAFVNALIEALARRIKGREEWGEWDMKELAENAILYGTFGWLPLAGTITNAIKGYDTSYPSGAILQEFTTLVSTITSAIQNGFDEKSSKALFRELITALSIGTGLPIKNVYDLFYGAVKTASPTAAEYMRGVFYVNYATNAKVIEAIEAGHDDLAKVRIVRLVSENCGSAGDAVVNEMLSIVKDGENPFPTAIPTKYVNAKGEEVAVTWTQQQKAKQFYTRANAVVARLVANSTFRRMTSAQKANAIRGVYQAYRQAALYRSVPNYAGTVGKMALLVNAGGSGIASIVAAVYAVKALEATSDKTKKQVAVAYVNKLPMSKNERLLVLYLAGYGVDENSVTIALRQKGMRQAEIDKFLGKGEK